MKVMQFRVGEEVEVFYTLEKWGGKVGGWIPATVLKVNESEYYEVETRTLLEINRMKIRVGRDKIRPRPSPEDDQYDRILEEGQVVEIRFFYDLWITGKVWEVHHHGTAGTNNITYSVLAVDPHLNNFPRRCKVSRSQIRVRRQWVDGEWVPTPPLRLHNQQGLSIPSIKSRDFSSGLKYHSTIKRRSDERTTLLQLRDSGAQVEVFEDFMNKWIHATIKELQENQIRVQYNVWSWVKNSSHEIDKFYDMSRVRSRLPPKIKDGKISLNLHQVIEVRDNDYFTCSDAWCLGEVLEIGYVMKYSNRIHYCVSHPRLGYINVKESEIRICQNWENGQGFQPSSALNMAPPLKRRKMEETHSLIGAEVEVYSFYHDGWITGTIVGSVGNQIEVEAEIGRKLWRITVDACRIRSRPAAERENNRIFKENEVVEVQDYNGVWKKGEIWEVHHGTSWKNLFYTIKVVDYENDMVISTVSKSQVRVRRKWVEENWTDSCIEQHSSFPSTELKKVRDGTWDKRRKLKNAQFSDGEEVEVFHDHMGGWKPGTIVELLGNEIMVEHIRERKQQKYDASVVRPKPPVDEKDDGHQKKIFQLHDEIEAYDYYNNIWNVGQILEVEVLREWNDSFYVVSNNPRGYTFVEQKEHIIRVHREWRDGKWILHEPRSDSSLNQVLIKETIMDQTQLRIGATVEVYRFRSHGWYKATISKMHDRNHIEVEVWIDEKKAWMIMHVNASRIRSPPLEELENDHSMYNWGEFIEVYSDDDKVWRKGEILGIIPSELKNISYSVLTWKMSMTLLIQKSMTLPIQKSMIKIVSQAKMRVRREYVNGKWIFPSFGTSSQPIRSLTKVVDEQPNVPFLNPEEGISNAIRPVIDGLSSINRKTRAKTDITWEHCKNLDLPNRKGKDLQCNYCEQIYRGGGINRMKQHLGHREKGDATPCRKVPESVRDQIQNDLNMVSARKKVEPVNASKKIQDKQYVGIQGTVEMSTDKLKSALEMQLGTAIDSVKEKIENEIKKKDNCYGDIFKKCNIKKEDTRRFMVDQLYEVVQQIHATNYENISEAMITEWYNVCSDQKTMNIDYTWLMSLVKELENCLKAKMAAETKIWELKNTVKEKIENEIRKIDLMMEPLPFKQRKNASEDINAVDNIAHGTFRLNEVDSSASKHVFNTRENDGEIWVHIGDYHATQVELYTLEDQNWIGSPVVNIFGQMLILKQKKLDGVISRHYFPTYFGEKIAKGVEDLEDLKCFYSVKNLDYNLTRCELLFIPICLDNHWFLYVINLKDQRIDILDSIRRKNVPDITHQIVDTCERILTLLNEGRILSISKWSQDRPQLPLQTNLNDCGVFMLKFMECWNGELTENFSQDDIVFIRKKILKDLMLFSGNNAKKETSIKY
ncbi:uncharacterized protein LOC122093401 isoform X2 [Macadamia integrifolia]|uniref:uncharacterized protein LOC122093401 isoform X2 n=1 Tax=Macadamia integrifolia TaxID=60698 RepID=UPI001C52F745|nr:uncharacterized protein LOC122093401 isoform X2 [Macadamia integrifolia]